MQVRDITEQQFEAIVEEIDNPTLQCGVIEMLSGQHHVYGRTILLRDADRCMVLVDDPTLLDFEHDERAPAMVGNLN